MCGSGPVGFLVKSQNNTITRNVAADGLGTAFWYKIESTSMLTIVSVIELLFTFT